MGPDDYTLINFYQGTSSGDPSVAEIIVKSDGRELCLSSLFDVDWEVVVDDDNWNAAVTDVVMAVRLCVSPTVDNPDYVPELTSCWT